MSAEPRRWLDHADHGECPVVCLLDCVFVLEPSGRISHYHREQLEMKASDHGECFRLNGPPAQEERSRCQIIPPFVTEFDQSSDNEDET